jgi:ABC-type sugar transport system permease subunit
MKHANGPRSLKTLTPWAFLFLPLSLYVVFIVYPVFYSVFISFFSWDGLSPEKAFIGLGNYAAFFADAKMVVALRNNVLWMLFFVPIPILIGFALAYLLQRNSPGNIALRTVFYVPMILAFTVMSIIWAWVYEPSRGIIAEACRTFGIAPPARSFLTNPNTSIVAIVTVGIWHWVGFPLVLYTSAIKEIPAELFDAAAIDGASNWQKLRYIIVPMVNHATQICISIGLVLSVKIFDLVFLMSGGYYKDDVLSTLVWKLFSQFKIGPSSAVSVIQFLFAFLLVVPYQKWQSRKGGVQF